MARPQQLIRRHRDEEVAARSGHAEELLERGHVVGRVLDDVEARDEVERGVGVREVLDAGHAHVDVAARASGAYRVRAHVHAVHTVDGAEPREVVEGLARAAARVEHVAAGPQREALQLAGHDAAPSAVPPVAVDTGDHGVELAFLHSLTRPTPGRWECGSANAPASGEAYPGSPAAPGDGLFAFR